MTIFDLTVMIHCSNMRPGPATTDLTIMIVLPTKVIYSECKRFPIPDFNSTSFHEFLRTDYSTESILSVLYIADLMRPLTFSMLYEVAINSLLG